MKKKWKISPDDKLRVAKECVEGKKSKAEAARETGVDRATIRGWVQRYMAQGALAFKELEYNQAYAEETKLAAVTEYLKGTGSYREIAAKYGLRSEAQLKSWVKVYNSGEGFRQKMSGGSRMKEARPTTLEERIQIARDCIANGENYGETALKFNVSYQQVYQWVKKYKEMGKAGLEDRRGKRKKDQIPRTELEKAQIEIERLKHELYMTKMERDLLKKLDEIERREAYRK